jgi:hypothetical protein
MRRLRRTATARFACTSIDAIGGESQIHTAKSSHLRRMYKECAKLWARI